MLIVAVAVIKVLLIALLGWVLTRKRYIGPEAFDFLNKFLVDYASTFLIFAAIIDNHKMILNSNVLAFTMFSLMVYIFGYLCGPFFCARGCSGVKRELQGLVAFQNCGYLPLNIAAFLLLGAAKDTFMVYIFIYLLGFNILMWSVGSYLIFKTHKEKFDLKSFFLPPVIGTISALLLVYLGAAPYLPRVIIEPMRTIGDTTFALSAIALGGWLASVKLQGISHRFRELAIASLFRLIGLFVVLIAAMPSAISLPVMVKLKGGDTGFASQGVFVTHLISIITIPLWLGLFLKVSNFKL
jgi:predicted permease